MRGLIDGFRFLRCSQTRWFATTHPSAWRRRLSNRKSSSWPGARESTTRNISTTRRIDSSSRGKSEFLLLVEPARARRRGNERRFVREMRRRRARGRVEKQDEIELLIRARTLVLELVHD